MFNKHYYVQVQKELGGSWEDVGDTIAISGTQAIKKFFPPEKKPVKRAVVCKGCPDCKASSVDLPEDE